MKSNSIQHRTQPDEQFRLLEKLAPKCFNFHTSSFIALSACVLGYWALPAQAEGSRNLIGNGGDRPYLDARGPGNPNQLTSGVPRRTVIRVFAQTGEVLNLGSSALGIGAGRINVRRPDGSAPPTLCPTAGTTGLIQNVAQEQAGPAPNPGGYTPCVINVNQTGIWEVEFTSPDPSSTADPPAQGATAAWTQPNTVSYIAAWDVTVRGTANGPEIPGRAYANYLPLNMGANLRRLNARAVVLTRDGYQYGVNLNGVDPFGFIFFANNKGFRDGAGNPLYQSVPFTPVPSFQNPSTPDSGTDVTHKLFFSAPANDLQRTPAGVETVPLPGGTTWLLSDPTPPPTPTNFRFDGSEGPTRFQAGANNPVVNNRITGRFSFGAPGNIPYTLTLRFGAGTTPRVFNGRTTGGTVTVDWNGLDGAGNRVVAGDAYTADLRLFAGEAHFPYLDAENNTSGIIIERLNEPTPATLPTPNSFTVYYNDSNIDARGFPGPNPLNASGGTSSQGGAHTWGGGTGPNSGFGDTQGLDTWVYYPSSDTILNFNVREADLKIDKTPNTQTVAPAGQVAFTITVTNAGPSPLIQETVNGVQIDNRATVTDNFDANITNPTWTCNPAPNCENANGTGNINTRVSLPPNGTATFTVTGTLPAGVAPGTTLSNTARVARPPDSTDPVDDDQQGNEGNNNRPNPGERDTVQVTVGTGGTIGDRVFNDANNNNVEDAGEAGIPGVTVTLNRPGGLPPLTATTNATGNYSFPNLPPGSYTVTAATPAGFTPTLAQPNPITLTAGQTINTIDFGFTQPQAGTGIIGDRVFNDANNNNVEDAGEAGIPGVTVTLNRPGGLPPLTATTNANGNYSFPNLAPGSYTVTAATPAGFTPTLAQPNPITLTAGQTINTIDFGFRQAPVGNGTISGRLFNDADNNATDNGEPAIPGIQVQLIDNNGNPVGNPVTTDGSGNYSFPNVPFGTYRVRVVNPPANFPLFTTNNSPTGNLTLNQQNNNITNVNFGYRAAPPPPPTAPDLTITKTPSGPFTVGQEGTYRITVTNDANAAATTGPITIVDTLPPGLSFVSASGDNWNCNQTGLQEITCNNTSVTLAPGASTSFTLTVRATSAGTGNNQADVSTPGETRTDNNRAIAPTTIVNPQTGSIGDTVFNDTNGDGTQNPRESGAPGVTVTLVSPGPDGAYGTPDDVTRTTTTDNNGNYRFSDIPPGPYRVILSAPGGTVPTTPASRDVTLQPGQTNNNEDFGIRQVPGTIGDRVFNDTNGNGIQDQGEPGVPNVTVTLTFPDGSTRTTTTDNNGNYSFLNLPPGNNYQVAIAPPVGFNPTTPVQQTVNLPPGGSIDTSDFGLRQPGGAIGDRVFNDPNGNGVQDPGEPGIPGVTVTLTLPDGSTRTTTTGNDGTYSFPDLAPGNYRVTLSPLPGTNATTPVQRDVTLQPGQTNNEIDFGLRQPVGTIGDRIFNDLNGNGVQDPGEPGVSNVTVTLTLPDGSTRTTTTDNNGNYSFPNLPPGNYRVAITPPAGLTPTTPVQQDVTLQPNSSIDSADFGLRQPAGTIGDTVFNDLNGNGVQDPGEPGLPNVTVTITLPDGSTRTTTTDPNGNYSFPNLPPGNYRVAIAPPAGTTPTNPATRDVTLQPGQNLPNVDFGVQPAQGIIGDTVFNDPNNNGVQDPGESGVPGATVILVSPGPDGLYNTPDDVTRTTTTDNNGNYRFNVPSGPYRVILSAPGGTVPTTPASRDVNLQPGQTNNNEDFGIRQVPGTIGDRVFNDTNGNGVQDQGEPGVPNVPVTITLPDGSTRTTTTDNNGNYNFPNLPPGNYQVAIAPPTGFNPTTPVQQTVTLQPGGSVDSADFGLRTPPGTISDRVFIDRNGNGVQDPGEPGVPGVTVTLTDSGPDGIFGTPDDRTQTTTTDSNGNYTFPNQPPGNYRVTITPPPGATLTTPTTRDITLPPGGSATGSGNFGLRTPNQPPIADDKSTPPRPNTTPVQVPPLTGTDPDGTVVSFTIATLPTPQQGTLLLNGQPVVQGQVLNPQQVSQLTFQPNPNFVGTGTFTYTVTDNQGLVSPPATVTLPVIASVQPPVANNDNVGTNPGTPLTFNPLINDRSPNNTLNPGSLTIVSNPTNGTVRVNPDGTLTYTPNPGFTNGIDRFVYQICDNQGLCTTATVEVTVPTPTPLPPVANDDRASTNPNTPVVINVLGNDTDPNNNINPTTVTITANPTNGTVQVNPVTGQITYTPNPGFTSGTDTFTYQVCDTTGLCDTAQVTVTVPVTGTNPPVANNNSASTNPNTPVLINVLANDSDPDNNLNPGSIRIISNPSNGTVQVNPDGTIVYTPNPGFTTGTDTFVYQVCDTTGLCDTATVTVTVPNAVPRPPIADDDSTSTNPGTPVLINVGANDRDPDNNLDPTTVQILTPPANGTVSVNPATGQITYTPNPGFTTGTDTFTYRVCDTTGLCDTATVTVTVPVAAGNALPAANNDATSTNPNTPVLINVLGNDSGNLNPGSVRVITNPSNGTVSVNPTTGQITYTPNPGFTAGTDTFTYQVCDTAGQCTTANVTVTVPQPSGNQSDLQVTIVSPNAQAPVGGEVPLNIQIVNNGPGTATGATFSIPLPEGVTLVEVPTNCTLSGNILTCTVGEVLPGQTLNIPLRLRPSQPGPLNLAVTVNAQNDVAVNNNRATANLQVVAGAPRLRLVKRITSVTRQGVRTNFTNFVDDPADQNDNAPGWSQLQPVGETQVSASLGLRSGDVVEYTIYFLSDGNTPAQNVNFCDSINTGNTFIRDGFGAQTGIQLNRAGTVSQLTNEQDGDVGRYFSPLAPLPTGNACSDAGNRNGATIVNLGQISNAQGSNFGFIRIRVTID